MYDYTGWIVRSEAGRDKGTLLCVAGVDQQACRLLLADGKRRKLAAPKRKKLGHVSTADQGTFSHPALDALRQGLPVTDRSLRRALAAFRETTRRV